MMNPLILGPLLGGIASTVGSVINNRSSQKFADRMSGTSYQRAVKDLEAAGLNKALAYGQFGGGASTPSVNTDNPAGGVQEGISNALQAKQLQESIETQRYQRALLHTQTTAEAARGTSALADADLKSAQARSVLQQNSFAGELFPAQKRREFSEALLSEYLQSGARNEARFNELMGMALPSAKAIAPLLGPLGSLIRRKPQITKSTIVNVPRTVYK
ncbi:DNA pilot protein [Microviridae sp.]|nr:DNA pilot protein [Microviridae sp.]